MWFERDSQLPTDWESCYWGGGSKKGERRSVKIHKRLLYCVNVNRTSLDHLLLGKCADVDRTCRIATIITPRLL